MNIGRVLFYLATSFSILISLSSCVPTTTSGTSSGLRSDNDAPVPVAPRPNYSNEQLSLRFLSTYIRGDREEAAQFATPEAIAKLPWKRANPTYIPHFDDRKVFWFDGGLAHVTFGEVGGLNMITDFKVHYRR